MGKYFAIVLLITPLLKAGAQDNFVPGKVTLVNGEVLEGSINDRYWNETPISIQFKKSDGQLSTYYPGDVLEVRIENKSIYRSQLVQYDSSAVAVKTLTFDKNPAFKQKHVFLKLLVEADKSLLVYILKSRHYFIQSGSQTNELINHPYRISIGEHVFATSNRLYLTQLREAFKDCAAIQVLDEITCSEKDLSDLFLKYASCHGVEGKHFTEKEKSLIRPGFVITTSKDVLRNNFVGSAGFGIGGFLSIYLPYKIYKYSLFTELVYRKFGDQSWTGLDYAGLPYKETHQLRSMKVTVMIRSRLSNRASAATTGMTYLGFGAACSMGLDDLYQRGPYVAKHAAPFVGLVGSGSIYLHKHVALEVRYEVGGGIDYNDYLIMDNRPPKSVGYSSLQGSLMIEF